MTVKPSNKPTTTAALSFLILAACYSTTTYHHCSVVEAFAGVTHHHHHHHPRYVTTTTSTSVRSIPSTTSLAFYRDRRWNRNGFCVFASGGLDDDDEEEEDMDFEELDYADEDDIDDEDFDFDDLKEEAEEEEPTITADTTDMDKEDDEEENDEREEIISIQDDLSDPLYTAQKNAVETSIRNRESLETARQIAFGPTSADDLRKNIEEFLDEQLAEAGVDPKEVEDMFGEMSVTDEEADGAIAEEKQKMKEDEGDIGAAYDRRERFLTELGTASEIFPEDGEPIVMEDPDDSSDNVLASDLRDLQEALDSLVDTTRGFATGETISNKQAMIDTDHELSLLDDATIDEIELCLNASATDENDLEYNEEILAEDPLRWILYDMDFNITELLLASCKHNPDAPLILNHWMPQLCAFSKYADARKRQFQFTWDDCENIGFEELERYYRGLGYNEIPTYSPAETNIVEIDTDDDDEDISMAAFESWMDEVYDPEDEDLYFDSEEFQPENNVYDPNYGTIDTPEVKAFEVELEEFRAEHAEESEEWRDRYAKQTNYTVVVDEEAMKEFRGRLVVACCGSDEDLEVAERITQRMSDAYSKQVHVETRVIGHARQSDNVYEIWLESYDITLLHSKRGACYNAKQWTGPAEVDDEQMEYLVERVGELIGDDSRYSYDMQEFLSEV